MRAIAYKISLAAICAAALLLQAQTKPGSKSIAVKSPSDLPEIAQRKSEAMYLYETGHGKAILYLQQNAGRTLAILDVTDPSAIKAAGQVSLAAKGSYDFVRAVGHSAALIEYRDQPGFAVLNFKKYTQPVLVETPQWQYPARAETLGNDSLLLVSTTAEAAPSRDPRYEVIDVANPDKPASLATIEGVRQRLERRETGTLFLLGSNGLTVVRRLDVEKRHKIHQMQQRGN